MSIFAVCWSPYFLVELLRHLNEFHSDPDHTSTSSPQSTANHEIGRAEANAYLEISAEQQPENEERENISWILFNKLLFLFAFSACTFNPIAYGIARLIQAII